MTMSAEDSIGKPAFVRYYENIGTRRLPRLRERRFPSTGKFPAPRLATPRAADWDADGDLDLIVSAREHSHKSIRFPSTGRLVPSRKTCQSIKVSEGWQVFLP